MKPAFKLLLCLCLFSHFPVYSKAMWIFDGSYIFCHTWLESLIGSPIETIKGDDLPLENGDILLYTEGMKETHKNQLKDFVKAGNRFILFHLSDEAYRYDTSMYDLATFVYRQYYHPKYDNNPKMRVLPLGYKFDFKPQTSASLKPLNERSYLWSFAGQINKSDRPIMIGQLRSLKPFFVHNNQNFMSPDILSTEKYQGMLLDTILAPSATGWINLDCFRIWESLECGCIPVVRDIDNSYFRKAYPHPPFIILSRWTHVKKALKPYLSDRAKLEAKAKECFTWWKNYENSLREQIQKDIHSLQHSDTTF